MGVAADPLHALTLDRLVAIVPEILHTLREDARSIRGLRDVPIAATDRLFATVCKLAEEVGLDLAGIPTWRNANGQIIGMRSATRPVHASWILEDIHCRVRETNDEQFVCDSLRWAVRRCAGSSRNVASILVDELQEAAMVQQWAEFAEVRAGNRGSVESC